MRTWNCKDQEFVQVPDKQVKFVQEIEKICKKYNLSISHEDRHGAFVIEEFDQDNIEWLENAHIRY